MAIEFFALGGLALAVTVFRLRERFSRRGLFLGFAAVAGLGLAVASAHTYEYLGDRRVQMAALVDSLAIAAGGEVDPDARALDRAAARLAGVLKTAPTDGRRWTELGHVRLRQRRFALAATAFDKAIENGIDTAAAHLAHGNALVAANQDTVTEAARRAFQRAIERDKALPAARFYIALHAYQNKRLKEAHDRFVALGRASRADAPWMPSVHRAIDRIAREAGLADARGALGSAAGKARDQPAQPGPTREDMAAAGTMTPAAREAMIAGMVARLAARMRDNPKDYSGWLRLARAYGVLGRKGDAVKAYHSAKRHFPEKTAHVDRLIKELNQRN